MNSSDELLKLRDLLAEVEAISKEAWQANGARIDACMAAHTAAHDRVQVLE